MRFATGKIAIRRDERWRAGLPAGQRRAVTALTFPLLAAYGTWERGRDRVAVGRRGDTDT